MNSEAHCFLPGIEAQKALMEFVEKAGITFEYIGYVKNAQQVAVRILTIRN